ncbi:MAG TPA: hypothetical protein PL116_06955, partial [Candidatus Cloacimonas sp.]|nr:hypothetical protein [Candidatus Cloacimonas sp.]
SRSGNHSANQCSDLSKSPTADRIDRWPIYENCFSRNTMLVLTFNFATAISLYGCYSLLFLQLHFGYFTNFKIES